MRSRTIRGIVIFLVLCLAMGWAQNKIRWAREGYRVEEKILMLSDRPEATKLLALGFDGALADILWIRAIQFFGGNFSSLKQPDKRQGMENLLENMFALDPNFVEGYQFAGFVVNESIKDPNLAIDYLLRGADKNPSVWKLAFDAGFIAFYQLQDYEAAKNLFLRSVYGEAFGGVTVLKQSGALPDLPAEHAVDGDPGSEAAFAVSDGSLTLDLGEEKTVGRINIRQNHYQEQSFRLAHTTDAAQPFAVIESVTTTSFHDFLPELHTRYFQMDQFQSQAESGNFLVSEVEFYHPRNPDAPSYVERMAIEMERNSGRFSAAWNQYNRYYEEAVRKGDEVSAKLALDKLISIYRGKTQELLTEAIKLYKAEKNALPSPNMVELAQEGYIKRILDQKLGEDPNFATEVMPVLFSSRNPAQILFDFDGKTPNYLMTFTDSQGQPDWYVASRAQLVELQESLLNRLQNHVNKFKEEKGRLPADLNDLNQMEWFTSSETEASLQDPLRGDIIINQETGKAEAVNPKL